MTNKKIDRMFGSLVGMVTSCSIWKSCATSRSFSLKVAGTYESNNVLCCQLLPEELKIDSETCIKKDGMSLLTKIKIPALCLFLL